MSRPGEQQQEGPHLLRADVAMAGATIFITLNLETDAWPFRIDNRTDFKLSFSQAVRYEDTFTFLCI